MKNLIMLFLCLPFSAFAQAKETSLLAIDFFYAPETYNDYKESNDKTYEHASAFRRGINLVQYLNKNRRFSIRSGINYAVLNQIRINRVNILPNTPPQIIESRQLTYYEIPLAIRLSGGKKKLRSYLELMSSINFKSNNFELKNHSKIGFSFGVEYAIFDKFALFAQPIVVRFPLQNNGFYNVSIAAELGIKIIIPSLSDIPFLN